MGTGRRAVRLAARVELRVRVRRQADLLLGRALGGQPAYGVALVAAQRRQRGA